MKSGHNPKGHQNDNGKILSTGAYQSDFHFEDYADVWIDNIRRNLEQIQREVYTETFYRSGLTESQAASKVHLNIMNDFYFQVGDAFKFVSHSTCFSCLRELPEHPLPCGHVLCTPCVKAYGRQAEKTVIVLDACPLHIAETWDHPWKIKVKPLYAGTRILSLDGYSTFPALRSKRFQLIYSSGGVRGIVELEALRAIERALGNELPIQAFFDLIVGTR
jgi:hypothetical protein